MAKKKNSAAKEAEDESIAVSTVEGALSRLQGKFGDNVFVSGDCIVNRNQIVIPVSPKIDVMINGGIPEGSLVVATGPPKVGKTSMCLHFAGMAQKPEFDSKWGPRHVFFHNIEMRLKKRDLEGIDHLQLTKDRFTSIESGEGNILTAEKHAEIAIDLMNACPGSIFVFDSFSTMLTQGRMDSEIGKRFRDDTPLLLADFLRRIAPVIPINDIIVLGVTHMIANQGMGYAPWSEASGRKVQYHCDVKLKATHATPWIVGKKKDDENSGTQVGQKVNWRCDWSALGSPGTKCESDFRYGYGIDKECELIEVASDIDIIKNAGAWFTFPNGEKVQGKDKATTYLAERPELYDSIYREFRQAMGFIK